MTLAEENKTEMVVLAFHKLQWQLLLQTLVIKYLYVLVEEQETDSVSGASGDVRNHGEEREKAALQQRGK